jgi:hypothetical protein
VHASFPNEGWKALLLKWSGFMHFRFGLTTLTLLLAFGTEAAAGPPFITDDPEPTDTGHWEIYNFAKGTWALGVATGQGGFDINYNSPPSYLLISSKQLKYGWASATSNSPRNIGFCIKATTKKRPRAKILFGPKRQEQTEPPGAEMTIGNRNNHKSGARSAQFLAERGDFAAHDHGPVKPRYRGLSPDA